ncbi:MAG: septum formation initiator family protein [bacterium]|nr:septum formation initiator family protein [bacterium]
MRGRKTKSNRLAKLSISTMVILLVSLMSVQIVRLYHKNQEYVAREASLEAQKAAEESRQSELEEYEKYVKTQDYIEDTAQSKLGLVYEDQIIFKEEK